MSCLYLDFGTSQNHVDLHHTRIKHSPYERCLRNLTSNTMLGILLTFPECSLTRGVCKLLPSLDASRAWRQQQREQQETRWVVAGFFNNLSAQVIWQTVAETVHKVLPSDLRGLTEMQKWSLVTLPRFSIMSHISGSCSGNWFVVWEGQISEGGGGGRGGSSWVCCSSEGTAPPVTRVSKHQMPDYDPSV